MEKSNHIPGLRSYVAFLMSLNVDKDFIRKSVRDFKQRFFQYKRKGIEWEYKDTVSRSTFLGVALSYFES